jgi:hypothetical protein
MPAAETGGPPPLPTRGETTALGQMIYSIYRDHAGSLWCVDQADNVYEYLTTTASWANRFHFGADQSPEPTNNLGVPSIVETNSGELMFATHKGLLVRTAGSGVWSLYDSKNSPLLADEVRCLTRDDLGEIWIGTDVGLQVLEP